MPAAVKPFTKDEILDKIKERPRKFIELAQTTRGGTKARIAARQHCDSLLSDGVVLLAFLGPVQYYVFNSPEAISTAVKMHIAYYSEKTASGCTVWTGNVDETRGPLMFQKLANTAAPINVRRWLFTDLIGRELKGGKELVRMKARCHPDCINPDHMVKKSRSSVMKGQSKSLATKIAMSKAMIAKWKKPPEAVEAIRASNESSTALAKRWGMSRSNVWQIRQKKTHALAQNPFSGLGAR